MGRLDGRVAFITGAARGQGRAHCVRLAEEGADIIALDIAGPLPGGHPRPATPEQLEETRHLVERTGRRIVVGRADVRDYPAVQKVVDEGVARFGRLDVVVANAGTMSGGRMWELTEEQWNICIDVNLNGVWKTVKASVPHMISCGNGGSIIITSSAAGYRGYPQSGGYGAAKHGVVGLCRTLAVEVARHNIRVNTIHPNGVRTDMGRAPDPERLRASGVDDHEIWLFNQVTATALPDGMQEPEDVADTVVYLAGDEGRFITGAALQIGAGNQLM
ncbi:mycofactocin-coupled SDR family oxidoreductase [Nocardia sp. CA2R105]|uniref:mycofactocin-coupled SDR family oxidoreductase n=1 Tax=Nocardia coffeae TaxID=2873381 RepID=UPI001CA62A89|nr:mycofactocin-coupled SDR family oxidoreductase [Nocardia coffeae]MBY8862903.1 mycofactocin-coupled SDR family oxidoreductase [Nocardia coffeae]